MFFINAIVISVIQLIPGSIKIYEKDEVVLEELLSEPFGIALMETSTYETYKNEYSGYIKSVYEYEDFSILYHHSNTYIESLLLVKDDDGAVVDFDEQTFLLIYETSDLRINYWDQNQAHRITRYQHDEQNLPDYFLTDDISLIENRLQGLTTFYMSLYQFVLYLILFGFIYTFMKNDVSYDFKKFKLIKNQWHPSLL